MATIPLDIIHNTILPRLPAKSLMRFKCVSKSWLSLISTHEFIHRHLSFAITLTTNDLLILTSNDSCLYSFNLDFPAEPAAKLPSFGIEPVVVGSCNGLLCIQSYKPYSLVLLNPSTGSYRHIPSLLPPKRCSALNFGFGYDSRNDDYKLVRIADRSPSLGFLSHRQMDRAVHVYSSLTNSWELIELISPQSSMGDGEIGALVHNNLLHWKFWCLQLGRYRIHCFNLCENQWTNDEVPLPEDLLVTGSNPHSDHHHHDADVIQDEVLDFGVLDGCLYLSARNQQQSAINIWVMNEYGVKESWVKLCRISDSRVFRSLRVSPIDYSSVRGRILLRTVDESEHKIFWYYLQNESAESAEINGIADCISIVVCKSSLVCVPGGFQTGATTEKG